MNRIKNMKTITVALCIVFTCLNIHAGEIMNSVAEYTEEINKAETCSDLKKILDQAFSSISDECSENQVDMYLEAEAALTVYKPIIEENPGSEESVRLLNSLSLMTLAAVSQIKSKEAGLTINKLNQKNLSLQNELNAVHESIEAIHSDKLKNLKNNLDAEKQKASELAAEAERLKKEAERKFSKLQSSLIKVSKDARGTIISMSDILFETGKAALTPKLETNLAKIAGILTVFKNSNVLIEGHTDNTGSEEFNQVLSEKRAESVKKFLIEQGVAEERLKAVGYGFSRPVADNSTKEGRAKNRRVDLIVQDIKPEKGTTEEDLSVDDKEETVPEPEEGDSADRTKGGVDDSAAEMDDQGSTEKAKEMEAEEEDNSGDEGW